MDNSKDGGPAFPNEGFNGWGDPQAGMTLRDYFAAHAPATPQPWFRPVLPPCVPHEWHGRDAGTGEPLRFLSAYDAERKCGEDFWDANEEARAAWSEEFSKQSYVQWPYAWADAMLRAREAA